MQLTGLWMPKLSTKKDKEYFYHLIPGDKSSLRINLTKGVLYKYEKELSQEVSDNWRDEVNTINSQRKASLLLSISYHCLGGSCNTAYSSKDKPKGWSVPARYSYNYLVLFADELTKMQRRFDRSKGCWTQYVRWAKGKALRRLFPLMRAEEEYEKQFQSIEDIESHYEGTLFTVEENYDEIELGESKEDEKLRRYFTRLDEELVKN